MPDSDSDDDFMSDKYLVEAPKETKTYTARRERQTLQSHRRGMANNTAPLRERERMRREEALGRSLFEDVVGAASSGSASMSGGRGRDGSTGLGSGSTTPSGHATPTASTGRTGSGAAKAVDLMMKMGWRVGEGLGRRRSASPERLEAPARGGLGLGAKAGIGAPTSTASAATDSAASRAPGRAEPIRISMWNGRQGLTARSPTPPPKTAARTDPDYLAPERHAALGAQADSFRGARGADYRAREVERQAERARELLVEFDTARGVLFHPLHAQPSNPTSLPPQLYRLLYPDEVTSRSPSPSPGLESAPAPTSASASDVPPTYSTARRNVSAAEKLREQMRRDMLSELGGEDILDMRNINSVTTKSTLLNDTQNQTADSKTSPAEQTRASGTHTSAAASASAPTSDPSSPAAPTAPTEPDWPSLVEGTKRVLSLSPPEHLAFLVSQLRVEHLYCFWCAAKYASWGEMEGPGGCPGEEEDMH